MTILYTVLVIWVVFGLLLYLATMGAFKCDVVTLSAILKDEDAVLEMSEKHRNLTMVEKFVLFLMVVLASPVLFIILIVMKKRGGV